MPFAFGGNLALLCVFHDRDARFHTRMVSWLAIVRWTKTSTKAGAPMTLLTNVNEDGFSLRGFGFAYDS